VKVFFMQLLLRLIAIIDAAWLWVRARKNTHVAKAQTAGAGIQSGKMVSISSIGPVAWPEFPTLAHGFWRAQELTLFWKNRGSCVSACLSNSVLEHLPDLDRCFSEVARVLKPDGLFIFSMTLGSFTSQLNFWTGQRDAALWVRTFGHFQQPSEDELLKKLAAHGFTVQTYISYQTQWTTALYRLMVSPCFQFVERHGGESFHRRIRDWLAPKVVESLRNTPQGEGACIFVIACKKPK
jgi:SAM-dependent methyltransferase